MKAMNNIMLMGLLLLVVVQVVCGYIYSSNRRTGSHLMNLRMASSMKPSSSLWNSVTKKSSKKEYPTVVVEGNYNVALGTLGLAGISFVAHNNVLAGGLGLLGGFLFLQTGKVRFVFDQDSMEVKVLSKDKKLESLGKNVELEVYDKLTKNKGSSKNQADQLLVKSRDNFAVGGANRWRYDTFAEWWFVPSKEFPVFMYFSETQTKPEGQFHLFPVIMNSKQLYDVLMERVGAGNKHNQKA